MFTRLERGAGQISVFVASVDAKRCSACPVIRKQTIYLNVFELNISDEKLRRIALTDSY